MNSRTRTYLLVPWLALGACDCEDARTPAKSAQAPVAPLASPNTEGPAPTMPPPEGTPLTSEQLQAYTPETLAGYAASGEAEPRSTPLPNGGQLPAVRRTYTRGAHKLQFELSDSLHAPGVRQLVASQQGQTRKTKQVDFRATEVNGYPSIVQWHSTTQIAIVNMVIGGRFLATIKVSPVDAAEPAIEVANALPVAAIAKLGPPIEAAKVAAPAPPTAP